MEQKLDTKKRIIIIIIAVLILGVGTTLAYIIAHLQDSAIGNASVTSDTTDNLRFNVDKDITFNPTQFNVVEGGGGLSDSAIGSATLLANSTDNNATYNYYVYFLINSNNYIYTTDDNKPEIVLTITDPLDQVVTQVDGLEYVEVTNADGSEVKGFDITTKSGLYNVASLYEITSTSSTDATVQEWTFTVTFINLDTNQAENGGKTLEGEVILSRESTDYHKVCKEGTLACNIAKQYDEENPESNGLYYHNGSIVNEEQGEMCTYNGNPVLAFPDHASSTSAENCQTVYSFAGMLYDASVISGGLEQGVVEEVSWNSESGVCQTTSGLTVYADMDNTAVIQEQCSGYAAKMGDTESVIMTNVGSGTMGNEILDANDDSYRYAGANPNNYVCFGTTENLCLDENLYRVIGVFDGQVKLIKADYTTSTMLGTDGRDYYGSYDFWGESPYYKGNMTQSDIAAYRWNYDTSVSSDGSNNWTTSEFNTINLNTNYWNYLGATWQNLIAPTTWHLGGMTSKDNAAKAFYDGERNNAGYGSNPTTYTDEIGLMYVSDYGYAAYPDAWTTDLYDYNNSSITSNNWLYMGLVEWTITPYSPLSDHVFRLVEEGYLYTSLAYLYYAARPVFYLNSNVEYSGGTGTESDPFTLVV